MESFINMVLLTLMAIVTIGVIRLKNLFAIVILSGIYSFLMASVLIVLDAVDVAMTEASVGAGISTVLLLSTLYLVGKREETESLHSAAVAAGLAGVVGLALVYGTLGLPAFGLAETAVHQHVAPRYLTQSIAETGVENVVTSVLASYRGFDTLGEVTVVFAAGLGVLLLLRGRRRKSPEEPGEPGEEQAGPADAPDREAA